MGNHSEGYDLLTQELEWGLPDRQFVSLLWIADLLGGTKKVGPFDLLILILFRPARVMTTKLKEHHTFTD